MIQKLSIQEFLSLATHHPVVDVRSPGEFDHAHIPNAFSVPLFDDEERKIVGTTYKQKSKEDAIKAGLEYFGVKMRKMVDEVEMILKNWQPVQSEGQSQTPAIANCVLVHCWRGGMRSAGVAWVLDLYGFKVYTLAGGYKAYRKWVLSQFEKQYRIKILGGYTGSGKTNVIKELEQSGQKIIDLELLAHHKGSAFGSLGEKAQPKQEMFENLLAKELSLKSSGSDFFWLEDESQRIGNLQIPMSFWHSMRKSSIYFLDVPFEERLQYITDEYGKFEKEKLVNAVIRIQKRLGGLETKNAINHLLENDHKECFRILLRYYDKWYEKALNNREELQSLLNKIPCESVDTAHNAKKLLSCLSAVSL